ncbi:NAD-dependent epimerase/dehydratase family protein [Edaphobacter modestus]|uniref:dTDP-L-rhamnose 4-epimerase n=1 Tax=Edaphobacter modestus TaxID=388466 RepID=A0A4Q7YU32_9BACT|nr:NAD-dependent epimerase/dehydratase family protein [Edaphobacter modestus]RZU41352.1 dTDP-L-rhamnose 4-epimerase [Edaphobacter modestus]
MKILITGGAGFIGQHLTRHLLALRHEMTILDSFLDQVHAGNRVLPGDLDKHVRLVVGDVADPASLRPALEGQDCIVHLAAETGTGQSMYEVSRYERTNIAGTALLYELLSKENCLQVERIVVASSRAIYGEGAYCCERDGVVYPVSRSVEEKQAGQFDPLCPRCGGACETIPTPETAPHQPSSFYGLTKQVQEQMALMFGQVRKIPTVALRYQNVYGPGQSLQNPYTGILAIFSNLVRAGRPIHVFEDGLESRDFVYIDDVVRATSAAITTPFAGCDAVNVGSDERTTVLDVARLVNEFFGSPSELKITGAFRNGDIRHGMADLTLAGRLLDYEPQHKFGEGLRKFLTWANQNEPNWNGYERSLAEIKVHGLLHQRS